MRKLFPVVASLLVVLPMSASASTAPSSSEIAAANAKLDRNDPEYVRCRVSGETGSLVKKNKICRTNAEWRRASESGNRAAREVIGSGSVCAGGPACNGN